MGRGLREPQEKAVKVFSDLKQSLHEALAYEQGKKGALRVTDVQPPPKPLTATQIRAIRHSFKASQAVFARIIDVSPIAVEKLGTGSTPPAGSDLEASDDRT